MKVIAKKFRGVWHYGVITGVVTEWVLEDYGGATQWRAVFEDGSGKVTVQSGWVMEDCLHHMETFSILNAGPLLEEARVKAIMTEKELRVPRRWTRSLGRGGLDTPRGAKARRPGQRGAKARRPGQRGAKARRPGQRGAKARRPGQRGAKARRPGQRGAKTAAAGAARRQDSGGRGSAAPRQRRPGQRGAKTAAAGAARRQDSGGRGSAAPRRGGRGSAAPRRGGRGSAAPRRGGRGSAAPRQRRPGQRGAKTAAAGAARRQDSAYSGIGGKGCITSCGRQPLKTMRSCRNNPSTGFWIPLIWLTAAGCGMQGRMTEVAVLVSPQSLHAAEAAQPHRH
eukprot:jgi/Tetstr1/431925/TSEL_021414.t1